MIDQWEGKERRTKPRGRPSLSSTEPSTDVHVTMPDSMYDLAYAVASRERISVPEVIRLALARLLSDRI